MGNLKVPRLFQNSNYATGRINKLLSLWESGLFSGFSSLNLRRLLRVVFSCAAVFQGEWKGGRGGVCRLVSSLNFKGVGLWG